jgi:hypothetical protein
VANDLTVNDFNLKDPIRNIQDGFKAPIKDNTPGFFQALKNPIDLWREESLPASIYQWISGNTKKKQAQEALEYIRNNPEQQGSKIFKEAERQLNRFGYLLDEGPMDIDIKEIGNFIKTSPKLFGAELINMAVADPYLFFMPLGWGRLGRGIVNSLRMKFGKQMSLAKKIKTQSSINADLKVGAFATLATPFVFSTTYQLGETGSLDPIRTTTETTLGASAGALFSIGFAGMGAMAHRLNKAIPKKNILEMQKQIFNKHGNNAHKLLDFNAKGIYNSVDELLKEIDKQAKIINDPIKFDVIKADMTAALRDIMENGKDMSINTLFKGAASVGTIFGASQFLTAEDEKVLATAKGFGLGAAVYSAGVLLNKYFKRMPKDLEEVSLNAEGTMDAAKISGVQLISAGNELGNAFKVLLPDSLNSRRKVFYYLTKANVDPKTLLYNPKFKNINFNDLTREEKIGALTLKKIFREFGKTIGKDGVKLFNNIRANYLPLMWDNFNPKKTNFQFIEEFDIVTGSSPKFQFSQRNVFGDINAGLKNNFKIKKDFEDPVELIKIYVQAASKALTTRAIISSLERTKVNNSSLLIRRGQKIDSTNYVEFKHPFFEDKLGYPYIHKGMENSLKMVFDARTEQELMSGIFTTNLMMKRLAVGFSLFHAGSLVESMWFAGTKIKTLGKILSPRSKEELQKFIDYPELFKAEYPHAIQILNDIGFKDVVQFAKGVGANISSPEDTGLDRFNYQIRNFEETLKRHFGINTNNIIEKTFKFFDKITWDRIFTHAKLHTFLTVLNKPTLLGVANLLQIQQGDTQAIIFRKATQAATFSNDAFGGINWEQVANRIQTPWLKSLLQTTFAPGSRGYMQLLMFAPDWTIANIRIVAKSFPAFESDPALRRLYQYYFARSAITYAAAGSALNYIFTGNSLLENTDPTRIDLGDGEVLVFSKQFMEPFQWITDPIGTGLKKTASLPKTITEVLTNKKYLTNKWSPNITKEDDNAIRKGLSIGGHVGKRFLPIWLQQAIVTTQESLQKDGLSLDLAVDTSVNFVLGQLGHPRYKEPRYTQYKLQGLVKSPYETLF